MTKTDLFTVQELALPGVLLITPKLFPDARGFAAVTYTTKDFQAIGIAHPFVQDFMSQSKKDVIRGLHFQRAPHVQHKLVHAVQGVILDVAADIDPESPTYGTHVSAQLTGDAQEMLYIPGKYAHGFCVMSDEARVEYKLSDTYHPECAGGVRFDDPLLEIVCPTNIPILSKQDNEWAQLALAKKESATLK